MTTRGGKTGKGIKLNKDGTIPKKNRRKTPAPPHRGIESSPVTQIKVGDGSIRDLLSFIGGNRELKVLIGKKAISNDEKEILIQKGREEASEISRMAGEYATKYSNTLTPSKFDITRQNMRENRNMGLSGTSIADEIIYPENYPENNVVGPDVTRGGPPENPLLVEGRRDADRRVRINNTVPEPEFVSNLPFGRDSSPVENRISKDHSFGSGDLSIVQEMPDPLKYPRYDKPQQQGVVPEAAMNVSRAQDARKYGMLGSVDEDKIREYQNRQSLFAPMTDTDLKELGKGSFHTFVHGGRVQPKKKRKKRLSKAGKVTSYNY